MRRLLLAALAAAPLAACESSGIGSLFSGDVISGEQAICPPVVVMANARQAIGAPANGLARSQRAYNHVAVVRSAVAACAEDGGNLVATVAVTYAIDGGPGTSGVARIETFAASTVKGASLIDKKIVGRDVAVTQGSPQVLVDEIGPVVIAPVDAAEKGGFEIVAGFQLTPDEAAFNRANPNF